MIDLSEVEFLDGDWGLAPEVIRISVTTLDDLHLPVDRRSVTARIPKSREEVALAAKRAGEIVENTIKEMFQHGE